MIRPKYKELYQKEKNKKLALKCIIKQYRELFKRLSDNKLIEYKVVPAPDSFDDMEIINLKTNDTYIAMRINKELTEDEDDL